MEGQNNKENDLEMQIMACVNKDDYQKRNLILELGSWRRKIKPLYRILGTKLEDVSSVGKILFEGFENDNMLSTIDINQDLVGKCQVSCFNLLLDYHSPSILI